MEFIIGIFVGGLLFYLFVDRKKPSGVFNIDFSDPLKDVCKLELHEDINYLYTKKNMVLKIKVTGEPSQE